MAQTIQINLEFNANTLRAKLLMAELLQQLNSLVTNQPVGQLGLTSLILQSQLAVLQLKLALNDAMNVDTGRLNLNKFEASLSRCGMNLKQLAAQMKTIGPEGTKAFSLLTSMIAQADTRMFSLGTKTKSFLTSIAHSAQYQMASSLIYGLINSFSKTIDYATELDTSLNNIRIVTGKSADEMARFAKEANKMAKELSTSTTKYTNASLIYYQQGLNDKEVKERTDTTVKLANVVGSSAQEVSEWMTAIWNNFDDGSKSLEYYADVLASLGAATASSADEIATGLEKFSAVADTVGLSYEYAASALATITAETRQSADVVGTALKTLFSRIEGLKLGDTLEDGTTLNQYSLALEKVGVNIKDTNNELKDMDIILNETGARWNTLSKDLQVALAQSVAGIRQYTQFIALMDNWDVMEKNLEITERANGALENLQFIYEESTLASKQRMLAQAEEFKSLLLGGDDLTKIYNLASETLEVITSLLDSMGGLKTLVLAVAAGLMKMYLPLLANFFSQTAVAIEHFGQKMAYVFTLGKKGSWNPGQDFKNLALSINSLLLALQNTDSGLVAKHSELQQALLSALTANQEKLTAEKRQEYEWAILIIEAYQKQIELLHESLSLSLQKSQEQTDNLINKGILTSSEAEHLTGLAEKLGKGISYGNQATAMLNAVGKDPATGGIAINSMEQYNQLGNEVYAAMKASGQSYAAMGINGNSVTEELRSLMGDTQAFDKTIATKNTDGSLVNAYDAAIDQLSQEFTDGLLTIDLYKQKLEQINLIMLNLGQASLQNEVDLTIAGSGAGRDERAFAMASLSDNATTDEIRNAMTGTDAKGNARFMGANKSMIGLDGQQTTVGAELSAIDTASVENDKNLADAKNELAQALSNYNKEAAKGGKNLKALGDLVTAAQKKVLKYSDELQNLQKRTQNVTKVVKKQGQELRNKDKIDRKGIATSEELADANKEAAEGINTMTQDAIKQGEVMADTSQQEKLLDAETQKLVNTINKGGEGWLSASSSIAGIASAATGALMGMSMLSGAFENIGRLANSSGDSIGDWISTLSSLGMGLMMVIPNFTKMGKSVALLTGKIVANNIQKKALQALLKKDPALAKQTIEANNLEGQSSEKKGFKSLMAGILGVAEDAGKGPSGWAIAMGSLAMIIPLAAMVGISVNSGLKGRSQAKEEDLTEKLDTTAENQENINENQELAESVNDLTDEYKDLVAAGESTTEVLSQMDEKIPELIDNYKELIKTLGADIDLSSLEQAYEYFKLTGDITPYEAEQEKVDKEIADAESNNADTGVDTATRLMTKAGKKGRGHTSGNNYTFDVIKNGDDEDIEAINTIMENSFGDMYKKDTLNITFDKNDAGAWVDYYTKLGQAISQLKEQKLDGTKTYEKLLDEYNSYGDYIEQLQELQDSAYELKKEKLLTGEEEDTISNKDKYNVSTLEEYQNIRKDLIKDLREEYDWTEAQAQAYLKETTAFGKWEDTIKAFGEDTEHRSIQATQIAEKWGNQTLSEIEKWYANLSDEDKTLFIGIDFSTVSGNYSTEKLEELLEELREKMRIAAAKEEAVKLGADENTFKTYAEILQITNDNLKDNEAGAYEVAAANVRVKKGLEDLNSTWDKSFKKIKNNTLGSYEYAEGLSEITKALQTLMGSDWLNADFTSLHLEEIQALLNGNYEMFEKLQDEAADYYIKAMDIQEEAAYGGENAIIQSADDIQNALTSLLDSLGDQEIGVQMTLDNEQYLNTLQAALDAGQITQDLLEEAFKLKGYDVNFKTHLVPGPTQHVKRTGWFGRGKFKEPYDIEYDETSTMTVPLIGDSKVSVSGNTETKTPKITAIRTADETTARNSTIEDDNAKNLKDKKKASEEIERYHELKEEIEDVTNELDALGKAKDRAYGANRLRLMDAESSKLEKQIALLKLLVEAMEADLITDQLELGNWGFSTDASGRVINYDEVYEKKIAEYNAAIDAGDKEEADDWWEDFENAIELYEETLNGLQDELQKVIDLQNQLIDQALEKVEYEVEFKIDADEFTMDVLEHFLSRLEDDAFAAADAIALIGLQMEVTAGQINTYMQGIEGVLGATLSEAEVLKVMAGDLSGIDTSKLTEQQIEDLKEYANSLMEVENQLREQHTSVHEKLTETIEAWNEEFDKNMDKFEKYNAVVENYKNIIDIVGKDRLGISDETMKNMYAAQKEIAQDLLAAARMRKEAALNNYDEIKAAYDNAVEQYGEDSEIAKKWKEQMDAAEETLTDATSEFYDSWLNALQAAADAFAASVETIVENFEESVSGIYGNLDALQEAFDRLKEINERYLEDYEKTYEISKLNRKINQDIAKTTNTKSQKELRDLQEQLVDLSKEGVNVSERDIQFMQKKYDLLVAELALRDAQNAKSVVRLQRDSEGNYGYIYTADQSQIDASQLAYEDAKYNLENWNNETLMTISELIITIKQNFAQAIQDISNDTTLNDEERKLKMAETTAYYVGQLQYWTDEAVKLNEYAYQANSQFHMDMADSINDSIIGHIMPDITDWEELYNNDSIAMLKASEDLGYAIDDMADDIDDAMENAGTSVDDFEEKANEDFVAVLGEAEKTKQKVTELKQNIATELPQAISEVLNFEIKFNEYMDSIQLKIDNIVIPALKRLIEKCKESLEALYAEETKDYSYINKDTTGEVPIVDNAGEGTLSQTNTSSSAYKTNYKIQATGVDSNGYAIVRVNDNWYNSRSVNNGLGKVGDTATFINEYAYNNSKLKGTGNSFIKTNEYAKESSKSFVFNDAAIKGGYFAHEGHYLDKMTGREYRWDFEGWNEIPYGDHWYVKSKSSDKWYKLSDIKLTSYSAQIVKDKSRAYYQFDTGGYTGSWGPEGRLAMLHQKEIVLNAHDTENLLSIVSMVRDMNDRIELNAKAMLYGLTAAYTANNIKSQNDTLQLEVHITAEFPNATNHSEIEEAFRNLTNLASQYANRKF